MIDKNLNAGPGLTVVAMLVGAGLIIATMYGIRTKSGGGNQTEKVAMEDLHFGYNNEAFKFFSALAAKGNIDAAYQLGNMYENSIGVAANGAEAIQWLTKSANAGNINAARQLGLLYLEGNLTVQDFSLARKWLGLAADAGDDASLRTLGDMSSSGLGANADPVAAYAYYEVARLQGSGYAAVLRDKVEARLTPEQQTQGQALAQRILARISSRAASKSHLAATGTNSPQSTHTETSSK